MRLLRLLPLLLLAFASAAARAQTTVQNDDDRYEAKVVGFQTTEDAHGGWEAYATLRMTNRSAEPLILAGDQLKVLATDEKGNRYHALFGGAMGEIFSDHPSANFALPVGGTGDALIKLYMTTSPVKERGKTFHVELPIADVTKDAEGKPQVGQTYRLRLTNLTAAEFVPKSDDNPAIEPKLVAGPFTARVTSAIVAPDGNGRGEAEVMTIAVTNRLTTPLYLACADSNSFAVDEHGRAYEQGGLAKGHYRLRGIPDLSEYDVDPRFVLAPGATRSFTFPVTNGKGNIKENGRLGVYLGLSVMKKDAKGKYHADQNYLLTFFNVRPTGRSATPLGAGIPDPSSEAEGVHLASPKAMVGPTLMPSHG